VILDPSRAIPADLPPGTPPLLAVVVDTEEEFDWSRPHDRSSTGVGNLAHQHIAHRVFERHGVRPTYVIDYPVASKPDGFGPLRDLQASGACEVGAHLHPWVNPPHEEPVTAHNSYPGNLPPALERRKLEVLTETIERNIGMRPLVYRAGRYGVGPATGASLRDLGYTVDTSVIPGLDLGADGGPDFTACPAMPYWIGGERKVLEVPLTHGIIGGLARLAKQRARFIFGPTARRLHVPGLLARTGLAERFRLTPEGIGANDLTRLAHALAARGVRAFVLSYHSPSLVPGHTPYVRTQGELDAFLDTIDRFLAFFIGELGGRPATLTEIRTRIEAGARQGA
jgi:hypothetical protein